MNPDTKKRPNAASGTPVRRRLMKRRLAAWTRAAGILFLPLLVTLSLAQPVTVTPVGEWPGFQRGPAYAVAVADGYAYVAAGGVYIFDTSQLSNLAPVGIYATPDARDVVVIGQYAYVADWETGFQIVDISDPAHPRRVGECWINGRARRLVVRDNYAYVAAAPIWDGQSNRGGGMQVIDISEPANPQVVGEHIYFNSPCVWCVGSAYDVAVTGNYAFLAEEEPQQMGGETRGTLAVFDISDPTFPWLMTSYDTSSSGARSVTISGNHAYVGNYNSLEGLQIIDISNPTHPVRAGGYAHWETVNDVVVFGNLAYLARFSNEGLTVVDISNPANPARVRAISLQPNFFGRGLAVAGDTLWFAADSGLWVFDTAEPTDPELLGDYDTNGYLHDMVIADNHAFLTQGRVGLQVLNLSNPENPVRVGGFQTSGYPGGVAVQGRYAYIVDYSTKASHGQDKLRLQVLDIGIPSTPELVGGCDLIAGEGWERVAVSGNYAYVSGSAGLQIVDISKPTQPLRVGEYGSGWCVDNVAVSETHAYLVENLYDPASGRSNRRLAILDISQPTNVQRVGGLVVPEYSYRLSISGHHAYLTTGPEGLVVVDVSDPANPREASTLSIKGWALDVAVVEQHIVVGSTGFHDDTGRVSVIHVGDPAHPQLVTEWIPPEHYDFGPSGIGLRRDRLYVADDYRTLYVLRIDGLPEEVRLRAQAAGDNLRLTWPSTVTGFALQSSADPTVATWDPVPGTPQLIGDQYELAVPLDGPARLFRLRKP
jgi:hypothetical protein